MKIGDIIKDLRITKDLSQQELANKAEISRSVLSQYENNIVEPTAYVVKRLAHCLEVSADYLLGLETEWGAKQFSSSAPTYTKMEQSIIEDYRQLNPACQKLVQDTIKTLLASSGAALANNKNIS